MSALDELNKVIGYWEDGKKNPSTAKLTISGETLKQAAAELSALTAKLEKYKKAYFALEFDEVTGECLLGCGGDSIGGHNRHCVWMASWEDDNE